MITSAPRWKEDKKAYFKAYYQQNKKRMISQHNEYFNKPKYCEICDVYIKDMSNHKKTKKHFRNSQNSQK